MKAVNNALRNQISLIEGPPGTGKTQTILNVLANLIIREKKSLVVSPNNEATKNVSDKLKRLDYGFLIATLGKRDNCETFITNQPEYPDDLSNWNYSAKEIKETRNFINEKSKILEGIYERKQKLAQLNTELREWELEYKYFLEGYKGIKALSCKPWSTLKKIKTLRNIVNSCVVEWKSFGVFRKVQASIISGVGSWSDYRMPLIDLEISLNRTIFESQIETIKDQISTLKLNLQSDNSDTFIKEITDASAKVFHAYLFDEYTDRAFQGLRQKFNNPWEEPTNFRSEYPIITSTTNAARNQIGKDGGAFDYIIIDESSQADLVTGMLALSAAKNAVVVGDTKQLACVITQEEKESSMEIEQECDIQKRYSFTEQNLLSSLVKIIEVGDLQAPEELLREHYRCHPSIIGFCNQMFYEGKLIVMTMDDDRSPAEVLFIAITENNNYDRKNDYNRVQAGLFRDRILPLFIESQEKSDIGVATPYRKQVDGMRNDANFSDIQIDTVHKYQGREKGAIAFITRANDINDFINNPNLINVAVSRAKSEFALIAAPKVLQGTNNIADLGRYITYQGGKIVTTSVSASFDLLYPNNAEARRKYLANRGAKPDDNYSEVQTEEWIENSLRKHKCETQLGYLRNYPLKQFLVNLDCFTEEQRQFINNEAHADFLFYRKSDRSIVFDLEVNGRQHKNDLKQLKRDELKKLIFDNEKVKIELEVLETNEFEPAAVVDQIIEKYHKDDENKTELYVVVDDAEHPWEKVNSTEQFFRSEITSHSLSLH
jgi:KaiC/GvpD/RAD55 family RecA-like ATPase